jgi:hypothetical protein
MIEMSQDVADELVHRLTKDYGFKEEHSSGGTWLRKGECPDCGKKELYAKKDAPWVIRCGRLSKCAYEERTKYLYPDAFKQLNRKYPATQEDPEATARAYLRISRGFDLERISGWYTQGSYYHPHADRGTATVRFVYGPAELGMYMERFIEEVTITDTVTGERSKRRARFHGDYKGYWWQPPGLVIEDGDEVMIAEGCIKAIALNLNGVKAVANLSAYNYPDKSLEEHKGKDVAWTWAMDNDAAGRSATRKFVRRMREEGFARVSAAQVPLNMGKVDWDDLHLANKLTAKDLEDYRYYGELLIAESAADKAILMYKRTERQTFHFEFNNRMYWFDLDLKAYDRAMRALDESSAEADEYLEDDVRRSKALFESKSITEIANCSFRALYFQRNRVTDESWYYYRISFPHSGKPVKGTFTGGQVSSASEFKKRLIGVASGAVFTGGANQLDRINKDQLYNLKVVETVDFVGYSKDHHAYVYNQIAVKDNKIFELNDEDFFDLGKLSIKTLNQSVALHIGTEREKFRTDWVGMIHQCFGTKGIVSLAWWLGALFAEQIREQHKSYPFIEIIGEPGAGKSTLIEFMWKLLGRRDYEGFDPSKSSLAARGRNFAQVSNLPIVLIESDRDEGTAKSRRFDFDELKTAYNGRAIRSTGVKNAGTDTYEPPFRAAICISQNAQVQASQAVHERLLHLAFDRSAHNRDTKAAAETLERMPMEEVSHFLLHAISHEKQVLEIVKDRQDKYERLLMNCPEIKTVRIAKNHAQIMSLVDALDTLVPISSDIIADTHDRLMECAIERQKAIASDHPVVEEFWEAFDYLDALGEHGGKLNHSRDPSKIAVNLKEFEALAGHCRINVPQQQELKRHLKNSRSRKFLKNDSVNSRIKSTKDKPATARCWVFENPKGNDDERS